MNAPAAQYLLSVANSATHAGHGAKQQIFDKACEDLGISKATLYRKLGELTVQLKTRKRRRDSGQTNLNHDEMQLISGVMIESRRANDKRLYSMEDAVTALRANGLIRAERIDAATGEVIPMSISAISRAMRRHGLHPDQLLAPTPHTQMRSLHPNHVWQIDASLCVLYYLKPRAGAANGLHIMDRDKFYKNKPKNLAKITADRVWSYEITDHASGWIYVEYVMGAESGENLCSVLINAMQERGGADMMHGRPAILYMDPGSANTSAMTKNLCKSLGINMIAHAPGNARATGQVEKARDIIERKFEVGLRFREVADLAELNGLATLWRSVFNGQAKHRRHGKTRSNIWMLITSEQLIKVPPVAVCKDLAVSAPVERKVTPALQVSFRGSLYDVSKVPDVQVSEKLLITRNPWRDDAAQIVLIDEDGYETFHLVPVVKQDEFGFNLDESAVFGESYNKHAETAAQKAKDAIEQIMTGTQNKEAAATARKAKTIPLGGEFDPYKPLDDTQLPTFLPRKGQELDIPVPTVHALVLNHVEAAKKLREQIGAEWSGEHYQWLVQRYPNGVPEDELSTIAQALKRQQPVTLRAIGEK